MRVELKWIQPHRVSRLTTRRCVVAGRLANLDHNLSVLLIEGGENNLNDPW